MQSLLRNNDSKLDVSFFSEFAGITSCVLSFTVGSAPKLLDIVGTFFCFLPGRILGRFDLFL
eukprot:UN24134